MSNNEDNLPGRRSRPSTRHGGWMAQATAETRPPFVPKQPGPKFELRINDVWPEAKFYEAVARRLIGQLATGETLPNNTVDFLGRVGVWVIGGNTIVETGSATVGRVNPESGLPPAATVNGLYGIGAEFPGAAWPNN